MWVLSLSRAHQPQARSRRCCKLFARQLRRPTLTLFLHARAHMCIMLLYECMPTRAHANVCTHVSRQNSNDTYELSPDELAGLSSMQLACCGSGTHRYSEEARPAAEVFDRRHQVKTCRRPRAKMCGPVCPSSTPSHRRRCRRSRPTIFSAPAHLRRRSPRPPCEPFATSMKPHQK